MMLYNHDVLWEREDESAPIGKRVLPTLHEHIVTNPQHGERKLFQVVDWVMYRVIKRTAGLFLRHEKQSYYSRHAAASFLFRGLVLLDDASFPHSRRVLFDDQ